MGLWIVGAVVVVVVVIVVVVVTVVVVVVTVVVVVVVVVTVVVVISSKIKMSVEKKCPFTATFGRKHVKTSAPTNKIRRSHSPLLDSSLLV